MENELKADHILSPATERPGRATPGNISHPPSGINTMPDPVDTFDTIPPTPQAQQPPGLPYQIFNSLTSTIGNMTTTAPRNSQSSQDNTATSPSGNYFPDTYESSSSGEYAGNQPAANQSNTTRKRGYSGTRAHRSLSSASAGTGGVSLGLSLTNSTLFYDIPMSDALSDLLEKHLPPEKRPRRESVELADVEKMKTKEALQKLMNKKSWRSVARLARNRIVQTNPAHLSEILQLWNVRLGALVKLRLYQLASAELDKLGDLTRQEFTFEYHQGLFPGQSGSMIPFELRILWANLPGWMKHPHTSIERLTLLAMECKKHQVDDEKDVWRNREVSLYIMLVNFLLEIKDYPLCISIMTQISEKMMDIPKDPKIMSALGRIHLQLGNIQEAKSIFKKLESEDDHDAEYNRSIKMNSALCNIASGEWKAAKDQLQSILELHTNDFEALNNFAVCLLYLGELDKAIAAMEDLITKASAESDFLMEQAIFNLCTLYELRSDDAMEKKVQKLQQLHPILGDAFLAESFKM